MEIHGIGELLFNIRTEKNIPQRELTWGLCPQKKLSKIEVGDLLPDTFLLDALISRLGNSADKLEYIVSEEEYSFYALRNSIEEALKKKEYEKVKQLLVVYEAKIQKKDVLHYQYMDMIQALLIWEDSTKEKEAVFWIEKAMDRTMPFWRADCIWDYPVSWFEGKLYLLWAKRVKTETKMRETFKAGLGYIEKQWKDEEEKVKIYPFAVLQYSRELIKKKEYQEVENLCQRAIGLLTKTNTISDLLELLILRITALKNLGEAKNQAEVERLEKQRIALEVLEKHYDYQVAEIPVFTKIKKEMYLDREIIRKNRKALGITQEKLSEGICTTETLTRMEGGRKSHNKNFQQLAEKVSWKKGKRSNEIACWDYKLLEKKYEIDWLLNRYDYKEAKEKLKAFPCPDIAEAQQFYTYKMSVVEMALNEKSPEEALPLFEEALRKTIKIEGWERISEYALTKQEVIVLNGIAMANAKIGKKEVAVSIYKEIVKGYERSNIIWQFKANGIVPIIGNLAAVLEEMDCFEEALELLQKRMELELKCRRIGGVARTLIDMAYILERQDRREQERKRMYVYGYYLSDLVGETIIKENVSKHFKEKYGYEIETDCRIKGFPDR
jgi:hypothetical protein